MRIGTADLLGDLGCRVVQAASGHEALRQPRDDGIELIVTDYLMPGMNGVDLSREARRLRPSLPILLITGYSTIAEGPGLELPRLTKPFRQSDIAQRIADLLAQPEGDTVVNISKNAKSRRRAK